MTDDAPPRAPDYVVHTGDATRERNAVIEAWHGNLGTPSRHAPKFDWFYLRCPYGQPLVKLLRHQPSSQWVGACAAGPRRMEWQGRELRAGVLVDMAVDAQHRTLGPAMMLQAELMAEAAGKFDLLYGFPNHKSLPVVKRLGYDILGQLPRYTRVLRYRNYLDRIVPRPLALPLAWLLESIEASGLLLHSLFRPALRTEWRDRADASMDDLWQRSEHGDGPITVRDAAFLRWRFDDAPIGQVRYLTLSRADGSLQAWFACQVDDHLLHVRDFWSFEAASGVRRDHLRALFRAVREKGYAGISLEYAGSPEAVSGWLAAGFRKRSQRTIIGRWFIGTHNLPPPVLAHVTAADEDE